MPAKTIAGLLMKWAAQPPQSSNGGAGTICKRTPREGGSGERREDMSEWINVTERMPEEAYGCLVVVDDEEPVTGAHFLRILPYFVGWDGDRWNDYDGNQCPFEVRYWIPLPNVPDED